MGNYWKKIIGSFRQIAGNSDSASYLISDQFTLMSSLKNGPKYVGCDGVRLIQITRDGDFTFKYSPSTRLFEL